MMNTQRKEQIKQVIFCKGNRNLTRSCGLAYIEGVIESYENGLYESNALDALYDIADIVKLINELTEKNDTIVSD